MGKFVVKEVKTGYKFDLKAGNGEIIATSEVYTSENGCLELGQQCLILRNALHQFLNLCLDIHILRSFILISRLPRLIFATISIPHALSLCQAKVFHRSLHFLLTNGCRCIIISPEVHMETSLGQGEIPDRWYSP